MQKAWTAKQEKIQQWLAQPRFDRVPPTQGELADQLRIHETTICRWKKLDGWQDEVNRIARVYLGESMPAVYGALSREAEKGSIAHIRTILELMNELGQQGTARDPWRLQLEFVNDWRNQDVDDE